LQKQAVVNGHNDLIYNPRAGFSRAHGLELTRRIEAPLGSGSIPGICQEHSNRTMEDLVE